MQIKEIVLQTYSLDSLKHFYPDVLGLELLSSNENSITIKAGTTLIVFTNAYPGVRPFYHFAFNIPENQFKKAKLWTKKRTELIGLNGEDEFDFKSWNAHSIYFYDSAGNILEFIARHNLRNQSDGEFSGNCLLNISEIGIPVHNVKDFFESVNKDFGIPLFSGDLKTFTAAGDDNGLLIIVPQGRNWFPDCPKSEIFSLQIKIGGTERKTIEYPHDQCRIVCDPD